MEYALQFAATLSVIVLVLYSILRRSSAIRDIPGPPSPLWIFGHLRQLLLSPVYGEDDFNWLNFYGSVYSLRACFGEDRLMVADPLALQYILNSPKFYRAPILNNMVILLFGDSSVITARGNEHRRLRAGLNPGFTTAAMRSYHPVFKKVAEMICDQLDNFTTTNTDVCSVLSPATLDAISEDAPLPRLIDVTAFRPLIGRGCRALPPSVALCLPYATGSAAEAVPRAAAIGRATAPLSSFIYSWIFAI
ncbi:cytochrome P450 [Mycena olivaceomarginata]|nr:cytochrome P450 [Mycena olivaceomarginata]